MVHLLAWAPRLDFVLIFAAIALLLQLAISKLFLRLNTDQQPSEERDSTASKLDG